MSEWRPIDTAPKDGSVILAFTDKELFDLYYFDGCSKKFLDWKEGDLYSGNATHWMPLPAPPAQ